MKMNNLEIINTELGKIPVIVNRGFRKGKEVFEGRMIFHDMKMINIETPTQESCMEGLKNAFELNMHFWLYSQLKNVTI